MRKTCVSIYSNRMPFAGKEGFPDYEHARLKSSFYPKNIEERRQVIGTLAPALCSRETIGTKLEFD